MHPTYVYQDSFRRIMVINRDGQAKKYLIEINRHNLWCKICDNVSLMFRPSVIHYVTSVVHGASVV